MTRHNRFLTGLAAVLLVVGLLAAAVGPALAADTNGIVVYQTDFGLKDGAVSAMKGVAVSVDPSLLAGRHGLRFRDRPWRWHRPSLGCP